ncbi:MAG: hypothetical protein U9Q95_04255, partial [Candidatus Eisenbacteria bacterium]|nr:hypothetical protein [Candidatus Eisenbacteria bacterium]
FRLSEAVLERVQAEGVASLSLEELKGKSYENARAFKVALMDGTDLDGADMALALEFAQNDSFVIVPELIDELESSLLTVGQTDALRAIEWRGFSHEWQLRERLAEETAEWALLADDRENHQRNKAVRYRLRRVYDTFRVPPAE